MTPLRWRLPSSPFPMWVFDDGSGAILAANEAAMRAYGYSGDVLLACNVRDLCLAPPGGLLMLSHTTASPKTGLFWQRRKDGSTFDAELTIIETGDAAHPATMVLVQPKAQERRLVSTASAHREVA